MTAQPCLCRLCGERIVDPHKGGDGMHERHAGWQTGRSEHTFPACLHTACYLRELPVR